MIDRRGFIQFLASLPLFGFLVDSTPEPEPDIDPGWPSFTYEWVEDRDDPSTWVELSFNGETVYVPTYDE